MQSFLHHLLADMRPSFLAACQTPLTTVLMPSGVTSAPNKG